MLDLANNGYTAEEVRAALHSADVTYDFRYELLDGNNLKKADLSSVVSASIEQNALSTIKRTARFSIAEDDEVDIDYLNDRIKPYMRVKIPRGRVIHREYSFHSHIHTLENDVLDGALSEGWVEYPLGIFLLSSPTRRDEGYAVMRDIDAYDGLIVLDDDMFTDRYSIAEGTLYYDAIIEILTSAGITQYNVEQTDKTLPRTLEYDPGTSKLQAVNDLLSQLSYTPMHVDVNGFYTAYPYRSPSERAVEYTYADDEQSITFVGAEEELDLFNVPNVFTVVRTNEEEAPLVSTLTNDNPDSPTSTVSRGRSIVDFREVTDIADQESLDRYVERIAFEASQVYGRIRFQTGLMPMHAYSDVIRFAYSPLDIDGKYVELSWSMDLAVGGVMSHEVRQIVDVGGVTP